MFPLIAAEREQVRVWRNEVAANDHLLEIRRIREIESEIERWPRFENLGKRPEFFEPLSLYDADGRRTGAKSWRGLCHWLGLRHASVHGLFFSPSRMVIFQRRSDTVLDSPGFLDMTFAGHMGCSEVSEALVTEAHGETGIDLGEGSPHIAFSSDLYPIASYDYVEPPRLDNEFYNVERRYVFAIRLNDRAMGAIHPLDREVSAFLLISLEEAGAWLDRDDVASALRVSGPLALDHAADEWHWGV